MRNTSTCGRTPQELLDAIADVVAGRRSAGVGRGTVAFFIIDSIHGDPGSRHETREECFEIIDGMVRDGIAEPGEFSVVELDENGRVVGEPFGAPSEADRANTAA